MKLIKEISDLSSYKPSSGDLLELYNLANAKETTRTAAFDQLDMSPSYFRNTYKELKDRLLDGILLSSFPNATAVQKTHFGLWKKYAETMILMTSGKRSAARVIGEEVIRSAEKYGLIDIAYSVSLALESLFAGIGHVKYLKYKEKSDALGKVYKEEIIAARLNNAVNYCIKKNRDWRVLENDIYELDKLLANNTEYKFRLLYYTIKHKFYHLKEDIISVEKNSKEALRFFESCDYPLPYMAKWSFLIQVVPIYVLKGNYAMAEKNLNQCIKLPSEGTFNWNVNQQYIAILGFYSNKPSISKKAYLQAQQIPKLYTDEYMDARWRIIHAYLSLYQIKGRIADCPPFELAPFINGVTALKKDTIKANILIVKLLHLLAQQKHRAFLNAADEMEDYISRHLKGKHTKRTQYFLRMLQSIAQGAFITVRVEAHAKKQKAKLLNNLATSDMNILETEIVPYELLWEMALSFLKK